jgi:DegV family protein with EDD domain
VKEISGKQLYYAFAAGGQAVISQREDLNKMNVYPVPDGDTGSNLSFTLKNIIEQSDIFQDAGKTMQSLAEAALSGARGNSGILFAQFVNGMAEKIGDASSITVERFSNAVHHAARTAYNAISNPVEGTMLTVMKDFAESLKEKHISAADFKAVFSAAMKTAQKSLAATKNQLEVLKKANVIDAGAKGFVAFMEGFYRFIEQGAKVDHIQDQQRPELEFTASAEHHEEIEAEEDLTFRFCTEGYITGENIDLTAVRKALSQFGDSLIVAGGSKVARVHIHTDHPDKVFHTLREHGEIKEQKADDMHRQYQMVHARKSEIALVVDSTCDLPDEFLDEHQIYEVPLFLNFGDVQYLDGLTIKPDKFYTMLENEKDFPRTSQPNVKTFEKLYDHLTSHYTSVISMSISSALSGTYNSSVQGAQGFKGAKISCVDTLENAAGFGLLARQAALDIEKGLSHEEVVANIAENRKRVQSFVFARNLKYFVKGGRVSPLKGLVGKLINLKPVIGVSDDGKAYFRDKAFSRKQVIEKILNALVELKREKGIAQLAIVHGNVPEEAKEIAARITEATGVTPDYVDQITPVLGAHGGPGAFDIAVMTER